MFVIMLKVLRNNFCLKKGNLSFIICSLFSKCINLDITTMVAYVSALTNGGCGFIFKVYVIRRNC